MSSRRVYPRPRGGARSVTGAGRGGRGLSPPTRGSLAATGAAQPAEGSIPAHAGEPDQATVRHPSFEVYPRPRGGAVRSDSGSVTGSGLSPPTRGSHRQFQGSVLVRRSIPAHAGEPRSRDIEWDRYGVYPRPRGGAESIPFHPTPCAGLSPPTRGSRVGLSVRGLRDRSIPAHAGEPPYSRVGRHTSRVYPRPRGGSHPRGRGGVVSHRSIPAHAGEPGWHRWVPPPAAVYPRPRGGAFERLQQIVIGLGLSPPTRGSPRDAGDGGCRAGSIPAHAGEP